MELFPKPPSQKIQQENSYPKWLFDVLETIFNQADYYDVVNGVIGLGESISSEIDLGYGKYFTLVMPGEWDAADLTFQASFDEGGTYQDIYDDLGSVILIPAEAGQTISIVINAITFAGVRYIKIRSGTTAVPVVQTASRTIKIICSR